MKKSDIILTIFWLGLSIFVMVLSYKYGFGNFRTPGPGLMPFLIGLLLFIICFYILLRLPFRMYERAKTAKEEQSQINYRKIVIILVSLYAYALFFESLGYLIGTFILLSILFRSAGSKRWSVILISSGVTVLVTYFAFTYLGLRFPPGILKGGGVGYFLGVLLG